MEAFTKLTSKVAVLDRSNVDTDSIIPKQFLKSIKKDNFGDNCFDEWRYLDKWFLGIDNSKRPLNPDFILNQPRYKGAKILLTKKNFGCGSSREHAPWALYGYGFKAIIAISFADIFFNNCYKNGLLPIVLDENIVNNLFKDIFDNEGYSLTIDLDKQLILTADNKEFSFDITHHRKYCLLNGLDEIGLTLLYKDEIKEFEKRHFLSKPWLK